jgi:two-component system, OmpR family, sensor kinase
MTGEPARPAWRRLRTFPERVPLRVKLIAIMLALVAGALFVAGVTATTELRGHLLDRVDEQLVTAAARPVFGRTGDGPPGRPEPAGGPFTLPSVYYVQTFDAAGQVRHEFSNPLQAGQRTPEIPPLTHDAAARRAGEPFTVPGQGGGASWRVVVTPFADGSGSVAVATSLEEVANTVAALTELELVIGVAVLVILGMLGYLLVRANLRSLEEIEATAGAIAAGDLSRRVPDRHPGTEVGRLARALNGMLSQIETAFRNREASEASARRSEDRMRRFVTDASHELRTPLTSIRGFAELYRQGAAGPDDLGRLMRRIEDEASRMGLLVDDLLLLARLDQQRPLDRTAVDLLVLAADAVHDARAVDPDRPVELRFDHGPEVPVVIGDEPRLRQVLANLVNNALTHTPKGTPVTVRLTAREWPPGGHRPAAVVEVADSGPGLDPETAGRVFERFYRADASRTRASGGAGLGLSIVEALVSAHGGAVELDTRPGDGAVFRVILPLGAAAAG